MKIKALSLKQPWANLVATGAKTLETRKWKTNFRGDILICSSQTVDVPPAGYALCVVELYDIEPMKKEHEADACVGLYDGALVWKLKKLRKLKNIFPVKWQLELFELVVTKENLETVA